MFVLRATKWLDNITKPVVVGPPTLRHSGANWNFLRCLEPLARLPLEYDNGGAVVMRGFIHLEPLQGWKSLNITCLNTFVGLSSFLIFLVPPFLILVCSKYIQISCLFQIEIALIGELHSYRGLQLRSSCYFTWAGYPSGGGSPSGPDDTAGFLQLVLGLMMLVEK